MYICGDIYEDEFPEEPYDDDDDVWYDDTEEEDEEEIETID